MGKHSNHIKMKFNDWKRLPRPYRAMIEGQPQVLTSRTGRHVFVPVQFV
ncbi:hypothetical protein [Chromobacterium amazonense]|uniref:Transposase n=1 Tax=Chromobacterium amazonense TaxID=1382803 RepID=A0ABU8UXF0_9NEIS|nr:hypothetical protein [Chromobacterium amazonense]MDQ4539952.1 hypothetical protein [Chromobacterium amazonense]